MDRITLHRSWVEISTNALLKNYQIYNKEIAIGTEIMAVVKADAYGHGERVIAKFLSDNGVRFQHR